MSAHCYRCMWKSFSLMCKSNRCASICMLTRPSLLLEYLVETEYLSSWWMQSTPATVIFLMSSFFIPMLEPLMVTEIRPFRGPYRGLIWRRKEKTVWYHRSEQESWNSKTCNNTKVTFSVNQSHKLWVETGLKGPYRILHNNQILTILASYN